MIEASVGRPRTNAIGFYAIARSIVPLQRAQRVPDRVEGLQETCRPRPFRNPIVQLQRMSEPSNRAVGLETQPGPPRKLRSIAADRGGDVHRQTAAHAERRSHA